MFHRPFRDTAAGPGGSDAGRAVALFREPRARLISSFRFRGLFVAAGFEVCVVEVEDGGVR